MDGKYRIKIKRDFGSGKGFWMEGAGSVGRGNYGFVKSGFVVVQNGVNCIPGAGWFRTIADAMIGIKAHSLTGDTSDFYEVYRKMKAATQ